MPRYPIRPDEEGPPKVAVGSRVEIELIDESGAVERLSLLVVPDRAADFEAGQLGAGTPLARALLGRQAGSTIAYRMGDAAHVRLLSVTREGVPRGDAEAERESIIREAVKKSEMAETLRLALTVDVKWGEYDPEGIAPEDQDLSDEGEEDKEAS
jgi:hypothetical protein